jgi:protein TonB
MFSRVHSLPKTLLLSTAVHLALAGVMFGTLPEKKSEPIELSFGTFGITGGGDGKKIGAPPAPKKIVKTAAAVPTKVAATKTNDEVHTTAAATAPAEAFGEGGTGPAVGDGVGSGAGGGNSTNPRALYAGAITRLIQQNLHYPLSAKKLGQQGVVLMNIVISKDGKILKSEITKKSPYQAFNTSSLEIIRRVGKFPPIPKEIGLDQYDVTIPVKYILEI